TSRSFHHRKHRAFGKNGFECSKVGLGCWQIGSEWGFIQDEAAMQILNTAYENGVTFFDTADVYGDGRSETFVGEFIKDKKDKVFVATKVGRSDSLYPDKYSERGVRECVEASLRRLGVDALDLIQLHCVPASVMKQADIFEWLRKFKEEGKIKNFGASVESMDEALLCLGQEGLCSLQIIFNIFRQKPIEKVLGEAQKEDVAIIVRLPLASGLLAGKFTKESKFAEDDHRNFNRDGQEFNVGETFAGLPFEKGVELADELRSFVPEGMTMAELALRWILDFDAVSVIIPGASRPQQAAANAKVSELSPLDKDLHEKLRDFYEAKVKSYIRGKY
ncbi:aldo/keto reductase, partial [Planctomycetota bacterium]